MTDDEIIAVVQARKDGKRIQSRASEEYYGRKFNEEEWGDSDPAAWDFYHQDYRVAPEPRKPREWWLIVDNEAFVIGCESPSETMSRYLKKDQSGLVHVREVI